MEPDKSLNDPKAHPRLGINAKRGCTDCPVLLLYVIAWAVMIFVAKLGFTNGVPDTLLRGTDYMANICGISPNVTDKPYLWYPISYNTKTYDFVIKDAMKLGLCVKECPGQLDFVEVYGPPEGRKLLPSRWLSLFTSKPKLHRCFPNFFNFSCLTNSAGMANETECQKGLFAANSTWAELSKFNSVFEDGFQEVKDAFWIILCGIGIVIALSFVWLFLLRRLVKPVVILTTFLVLAAVIGLGIVLWIIKGKKEGLDPPQTEAADYYKYGAITAWVVAFIFLCVILFLWRDVMTACDIIEEATKVPLSIPTMVLVPPFAFIATIPFIVFFLIVAVYIQSSGDKVDFKIPGGELAASAAGYYNNITTQQEISSNTTEIFTKEYQFSNWRIYAHFYNLFVFLWTFGFISAVAYMTLAFCGVYWYWSFPGDNKSPPLGAVCLGMKTTLRYHMGTVALGSLVVAIIQVLRVVLAFVEQHLKQIGERTDAAKFFFRVMQCYLAYLERVVKFINKNGYIMCAMQGSNFITSARDALNLLAANALSVGAVTVIAEYVMMFGKVLVTCGAVIITYVIIDKTGSDGGITGGWLILLIVLVLGFLISCLFASVFSVCIDTVLLCYCYDKNEDGDDYYPTDLGIHVAKAAAAKGKTDAAKKTGEQELTARLKGDKKGDGLSDL